MRGIEKSLTSALAGSERIAVSQRELGLVLAGANERSKDRDVEERKDATARHLAIDTCVESMNRKATVVPQPDLGYAESPVDLELVDSRYESGRSSSLLKVKTFHDTEAIVVAHLPGAGRHKGRLGALECDLPNGTRFSVGTGLSDAERRSPPVIGSVITFRYQELSTDGVPRFPSYVGVREDFAWPPDQA